MFKVCVGHSNDPDSRAAIAEVLEQCQQSLAGEMPQAAMLLMAIDFDYPMILAEIQAAFPGIELIGGTTNGEISSVLEFQEDSLSLMVFCADRVEIRAGLGRGLGKDPAAAVQEAIQTATSKLTRPPKLCLTLPDSLNINGVLVVQSLQKELGAKVPILGGTAGDNLTFDQTRQFFNGEVAANALPILVFAGDLDCSHGIASGWKVIGNKSQITKAEGCVIYEIDGQRAVDFYRNSLGTANVAAEYISYPLAIFEPGLDDFYLRSPWSHDEETGSMTFTASIPSGAQVQMTEATRENVMEATTTSLNNALTTYPGDTPAAAIVISCAARRLRLGTEAKEEYEIFKTNLPAGLPCCGFYSYGEIAPLQQFQPTYFHNQTFVTLLVGESGKSEQ
jgi:hypothetical protein